MSSVEGLCRAVMMAVAASGCVTQANTAKAVEVMRAEIKALVVGEEYAAERAAVLLGGVSEQTVLASVALSCVAKIRGA